MLPQFADQSDEALGALLDAGIYAAGVGSRSWVILVRRRDFERAHRILEGYPLIKPHLYADPDASTIIPAPPRIYSGAYVDRAVIVTVASDNSVKVTATHEYEGREWTSRLSGNLDVVHSRLKLKSDLMPTFKYDLAVSVDEDKIEIDGAHKLWLTRDAGPATLIRER